MKKTQKTRKTKNQNHKNRARKKMLTYLHLIATSYEIVRLYVF